MTILALLNTSTANFSSELIGAILNKVPCSKAQSNTKPSDSDFNTLATNQVPSHFIGLRSIKSPNCLFFEKAIYYVWPKRDGEQ